MEVDSLPMDTKQVPRRICGAICTVGIEDKLARLGIEVLGCSKTKLPKGWSAEHCLHQGAPTLILDENGNEVARWDGGGLEAKFFIVGTNGKYSKEDLEYMAAHIHCHSGCHEVKVAKKKKRGQNAKRRETDETDEPDPLPLKRQKTSNDKKTTDEKKPKKIEIQFGKMPFEWISGPLKNQTFHVDKTGIVCRTPRTNFQMSESVDFPASIMVRNTWQNVQSAEEIKEMIAAGHTARAFNYGRDGTIEIQFGRSVEEDRILAKPDRQKIRNLIEQRIRANRRVELEIEVAAMKVMNKEELAGYMAAKDSAIASTLFARLL